MSRAASELIAAAPEPDRHPQAVAAFIAAWMAHCPNPQRDAARQVAGYALMLLAPETAIYFRRSLLDALYLQSTGLRFPRGEAEDEYRAELAFARRIHAALTARGLAPRDLIDVQSLLWVAFRAEDAPSADITAPAAFAKDSQAMPLNTILYGPPGTGKTHATRAHAVAICDGAAEGLDEGALQARYESLREAGRIAFVTFHQSFSYEDFVEGLRPQAEGAGFQLVPTPGILRKMADLAAKGRAQGAAVNILSRGVFKVSYSGQWKALEADLFHECLTAGYVLLGKGGQIDWSDPSTGKFGGILARWQTTVDPKADFNNSDVVATWSFRDDMEIGDIVLLTSGISKVLAIGEVTGSYEYRERPDGRFPHRRAVRWTWAEPGGLPADHLIEGQLGPSPQHRIEHSKVKRAALAAYLTPEAHSAPLPHVLVIDEINRANVSKVFGELITLLEEDKRTTGDHPVTLRLPYSGEAFSLPGNLHILGTMNTADRSIALLDTALRRRFEFVEMAPRPDLLGVVDGLDLGLLVTRLNERIEYLYDRDHLIGHAFFMGAASRADIDIVMRRKVIPLLAEYFHEDWERIVAVLGGPLQGFIERIALTPPPGLDLDEPRWRFAVRATFPPEAYAGLQA